ncbi:MAG: putative baseplate assembly protein, partial [Proteobacteria bacterium]|nr:putative baseplate assembly protein [Pseudomonadota bacterium]
DIEAVKVAGQENYWIRVRIISGDYGKEEFIRRGETWISVPSQINPPIINELTITYTPTFQNLQHCLSYNNLEFKDVTEESKTENKTFKPFQPLDDDHQTLYLGFDNKLEKAPISLFFSIEEQPWSVDKIPSIEWEYYAGGGKWVRLEVLDETRGLLRSGAIEFVFPRDFKKTKKFGEALYWIRAVDVRNSFKPIRLIYAQLHPAYLIRLITAMRALSRFIWPKYLINAISLCENLYQDSSAGIAIENPCDESISELEPCPALLEAFQPEWDHIEEVKEEIISPKIKGIFLNTTWAVQAETIKEELLGSSDGTAGQSFTLSKTPIITEGIWVNELGTITEEERSNLIEKAEFEVRVTKEEEGKVTELWVKWEPVEDFLASSKDDRHYEIDRVSREVKFGDGIYGKIPPIGRDNITVDYRSGGGSKGNVIADEIKDLKSSIAYVDKASNPLAAGGGTDIEDIDECIERGPLVLKHRNRAVTASDFEEIAYQASRAIGRAKCLSNFDNQGHFKPGWVTVIVIPESGEAKPKLSLQLKRRVETYLREHSANTLQLQVSEPVYAEASVTTILIATDIDAIPIVEKEAFIMLRGFLHPLTGGYEGNGWEFGRMPCISDFYALLEKIGGVDYVKELSVYLRTYAEDKIISEILITPERPVDIEIPPYAVVYSGMHGITVNIEKTAGGK